MGTRLFKVNYKHVDAPFFYKIFKQPKTIQRHSDAPLLKERLIYLQYWTNNGASRRSLLRIAQYLLVIIDYLKFYKLRIVTLNEIKDAADCWATSEAIRKKSDLMGTAKAQFVREASDWIEMLGCLKQPTKKSIPFEDYLNQYINYIRDERGCSEKTIKLRFYQIKDFLRTVKEQKKNLIELTPLTIDKILMKKYNINDYSRSAVHSYASAIRSFLRYAEDKSWCQKNLSNSIKTPHIYKDGSLPYSPSWNDVKKLLATTESNDPTDIRDRAILMLLSVYGMRSSEVVNLRLDDIDWRNELLYLRRAKTGKPQVFPLSQIVGEAVLHYLKKARYNNSLLREVFLSTRAPYHPLTSDTVYYMVSKRFKLLDLKLKHHGAHALRHACATHLINEGVSLKVICDYLGHQKLDTTRIYAKVDLVNLRKVAAFELGDLL